MRDARALTHANATIVIADRYDSEWLGGGRFFKRHGLYSEVDSSGLLSAFGSWSAGYYDVHFDNAVLLSGRDFAGSVVGVAWMSGMCTA